MGMPERRPLTRELIFTEAVRLVDEERLAALSMRRLGRRLGVEAMSLYKHVANKEDLLEGMVGTLLREIDIPAGQRDWVVSGRAASHSFRRVALAHPHVFPLIVEYPPNIRDIAGQLAAVLTPLRRAGFSAQTTVQAFHTITSYVVGYALAEIFNGVVRVAGPPAEPDMQAVSDRQDLAGLAELVPYLVRQRGDEEFEFGLEVILRGLQVLLVAEIGERRHDPIL